MDNKQPILGSSIAEIKLFDEPNNGDHIERPEKPKRGRKKTGKYVEYHEAKAFIHGELIQSRTKYYEWWERHKPKDIPKYPYRIYQLEWESWNVFLGNENTFGIHNANKWRSYEEAMIYIHSLNIASYTDWLTFCKEDKIPEDIPARPDLVYPKWRTWNHWLGNKAVEAVEAKREAEGKNQIYYIIHEQGVPENVLTFGVEPSGASGLKERWDREQFTIVRAFWYNREEADYITNVVHQLSNSYLGEERQRIVPNYWEIIYYLEQKLDRANLKAAYQTSAALKRTKDGINLL
jgi:hypothetical protein